jgi:hypothetical protein
VCCEHLVCAACSGHVADARCGVCFAARARLHGDAMTVYVPEWLVALVVLLITLVLLAATRAAG